MATTIAAPALAARLVPADVAGIFRRHPVTVRNALASGELHGTQRVKGGRWLIDQDCAVAWAEGRDCAHQLEAHRVRPLRVVGGAR